MRISDWSSDVCSSDLFGYGYAVRVSPSAMIDPLMRDLSATAAVLGTLAGIYFYVYAAMQLPLGLAIDRIGPRRILTIAALVCGAGVALFAAADGLFTAYLGRALIGAGAAGDRKSKRLNYI